MINKYAAMGEGIFMIYRLLLISFIAFIILGVSSVSYSHYIDTRDAEASIMARELVNCVSPKAVVELSRFSDNDRSQILSYCGFDEIESERFFVRVIVEDLARKEIVNLHQGDSGTLWVKEFFKSDNLIGNEIGKYWPGYFSSEYQTYVLDGSSKNEGFLKVEVLVNDEF